MTLLLSSCTPCLTPESLRHIERTQLLAGPIAQAVQWNQFMTMGLWVSAPVSDQVMQGDTVHWTVTTPCSAQILSPKARNLL